MNAIHPRRLAAAWILASACIGAACSGRISFEAAPVAAAGGPGAPPPLADEPRPAPDAGPPAADDAGPAPIRGGDTNEPPALVFCDAPTLVLMASCGNGSCHSNAGVTIGDFAVSPERAAAFVDRVSARDPSCGRIIDSRSYGDSLLLTKVTGTYPAHCGGRMPVGSFTITDAQITCLASWLQQFQR